MADPGSDLIVYAERAIPADRRAPVDRDSAYADLDYAIYFGLEPTSRTCPRPTSTQTLPFDTLTKRQVVPFGDTELTLVTTPSRAPRFVAQPVASADRPAGWGPAHPASASIVTRLMRFGWRPRRTPRPSPRCTRTSTRCTASSGAFRAAAAGTAPAGAPVIRGLEFASAYVAGAEGVDIGGDWYSVIATEGDQFAFVVGDVSGRGLDAVAVMAHARFALRAYLVDGDSPELALEKCSRQFDITVDHHMTTALVEWAARGRVKFGWHARGTRCRCSSREDADFVYLPVGPPFGTGPAAYTSTTFTLPPGDADRLHGRADQRREEDRHRHGAADRRGT